MPQTLLATAVNFALAARDDGWLELLPVGAVNGRDGRSWNNHAPAIVIGNIIANGVDLPIDINHSTEIKAPRGEESPAQGWIKATAENFRVENGMLLGKPEWNSPDDNPVTRKEYRYTSPVIDYDPNTLDVYAITSIGLTNDPNLRLAALNSRSTPTTEDATMLKDLLAALGLPENTPRETALNAIQQLKTDKATAANAANNPPLDKFVPRSDYDTALNRASSAEQKLREAEAAKTENAIETAINAALTAGKITPATVDYHKAQCRTDGGMDRFNAFVAAQPVNPAATATDLNNQQPGGLATALNAEDKQVAKLLGMTDAEFANAKGAQA